MVVHRFTVVTLPGGLSVEGILLVFPRWHPATGSQFAFTCMLLKEEKRFPYFSSPEQNRTERRDTHMHSLNIQKNKQMPVWCILGAIWGGSLHTKEHSLVCQVSVECRNRPWCLATDDDLIKWKGGRRVQGRGEWWFGGGGGREGVWLVWRVKVVKRGSGG